MQKSKQSNQVAENKLGSKFKYINEFFDLSKIPTFIEKLNAVSLSIFEIHNDMRFLNINKAVLTIKKSTTIEQYCKQFGIEYAKSIKKIPILFVTMFNIPQSMTGKWSEWKNLQTIYKKVGLITVSHRFFHYRRLNVKKIKQYNIDNADQIDTIIKALYYISNNMLILKFIKEKFVPNDKSRKI